MKERDTGREREREREREGWRERERGKRRKIDKLYIRQNDERKSFVY